MQCDAPSHMCSIYNGYDALRSVPWLVSAPVNVDSQVNSRLAHTATVSHLGLIFLILTTSRILSTMLFRLAQVHCSAISTGPCHQAALSPFRLCLFSTFFYYGLRFAFASIRRTGRDRCKLRETVNFILKLLRLTAYMIARSRLFVSYE